MEKKNDWIAALINRPNYSLVDMYANDIKPENTGLQDKSYYKNIPQVVEKFTGEDGKFDEKKFGEFYDSALRMYNTYTDGDFLNKLINNISLSPYDWTKDHITSSRDVSAVLSPSKDPYRRSAGLRTPYSIEDPSFSMKEVAQTNKVRDENGNVLDWTPNDKGGLWKGLFRPTLVYAQYDEDTEEEDQYGNLIYHKKGEWKLDENGNPYTELLGSRNSYGKELVNYGDTLTIEGTRINKMDFFDSDGLTKSVGGTIAKNAVKLMPFVLGPTVGAVAGTAYALFGLASVLPVIGKMINGTISAKGNDNEFGRSLTRWESYMQRFSPTMSEKGSQSFWTLESLSEIIASSASQLYSQRQVAKIPQWLNRGKQTLRGTKVGQQLALGYMATTSAQDVYGDYIEAGVDERWAGVAALGTMAAYYGLMNNDYFKRHFFGDSFLNEENAATRSMIRSTVRQTAADARNVIGAETPKSAISIFSKIYNRTSDFLNKNVTRLTTATGEGAQRATTKAGVGFLTSAADYVRTGLNEGIEEVMEEATSDIIKGLTLGLEALGADLSEDGAIDFGFSSKDFLTRYSAAFVGGTIGGAVFEGLGKWEAHWTKNRPVTLYDKDLRERMIILAAYGHAEDMRQEVERLYKKGLLANANLSIDKDSDNNELFKPGTESDNQNLLVRNILLQNIDYIEKQITDYVGVLKQSDLFMESSKKLVEESKKAGLTTDEYSRRFLKDPFIQTLLELGAYDQAQNDFVQTAAEIVELNTRIKEYEDNILAPDSQTRPNQNVETPYYKKLKEQRDNLVKRAQDIREGKNLDQYLQGTFFRLNPDLVNFYFANENGNDPGYYLSSVEAYTQWKYDLDYNSLSVSTKNTINEEYQELKNVNTETRENFIRRAQLIHFAYADRLKSQLEEISEAFKEFRVNEAFVPQTMGELAQVNIEQLIESNKAIDAKMKEIELENPNFMTDADWTGLNAQYKENEIKIQNNQIIMETDRLGNVRLDVLLGGDPRFSSVLASNQDVQEVEKIDSAVAPYTQEGYTVTDQDRAILMQQVLDYYNYLLDNKVINSSDKNIENALGLAINQIPKALERLSQWNLQWAFDTFYDSINLQLIKDYYHIDDVVYDDVYEFLNDSGIDDNLKQQAFGDALVFFQTDSEPGLEHIDQFLKKVYTELSDAITMKPFSVIQVYNDLLIEAGKNSLTEEEFKYLIGSIIDGKASTDPDSTGSATLDNLKKILEARAQTNMAAKVYDFIKQIEIYISGASSKLWDVLQGEETMLSAASSISDYVTSPDVKNTLKYGIDIINLLLAQVSAATENGFNSMLNPIKEALGKEKLVEMDQNSAKIMAYELETVNSKLKFLLKLAEQNKDSMWREQQDTGIHMEPMFVRALLERSDLIKGKVNWLDLEAIWNSVSGNISDLTKITIDDYEEFEIAKVKFENAVYDEINKVDGQNDRIEQFSNALAEVFGTGEPSMRQSEYSKSLKYDELSSWSVLSYLMAIGFEKTQPFLEIYKTVLQNNERNIVPFKGQEFIVRQAFAYAKNVSRYNILLTKIEEQMRKTLKDDYLVYRSKLSNLLYINGNSAVGKSTAISWILYQVLKADSGEVVFKGSARFDTRKNNLIESLGLTENDENFRKIPDLVREIFGENLNVDDLRYFEKLEKNNHGHLTQISGEWTNQVDRTNFQWFDATDKIKVLVVDEITLANEAELQLLSYWANKNGILIIGLGNDKQNAWKTRMQSYDSQTGRQDVGNTIDSSSGIEDCLVFSTPILKASLRTQNDGKRRNKDQVEAVLQNLQTEWYKTYELDKIKYDNSKSINLIYYEDANGIYGDKFVTDDNELNTLISKVKDGEKVLIITDDINKYNAVKASQPNIKIDVVDPNEAQGSEAEYVFVDKSFSSNKTIKGTINPLLFFRDFYTMITRGKKAVFIKVDETNRPIFTDTFNVKTVSNPQAKSEIRGLTENTEALNAYKKWRMDLLDKVTTGVSTPNSSGSGTSTSSTSTTTTSTGGTTSTTGTSTSGTSTSSTSSGTSGTSSGSTSGTNTNWYNRTITPTPDGDRESYAREWRESALDPNNTLPDTNESDYRKRKGLEEHSNIDLDQFIDSIGKGTYDDRLDLLGYDTIDAARDFVSYLALAVCRYMYKSKTSTENVTFDKKFLRDYLTLSNKINQDRANEIFNAINIGSDTRFYLQKTGTNLSTAYLPIVVGNKYVFLPIFTVGQELNGVIALKDINMHDGDYVGSIAVSSNGRAWLSLSETARRKAFITNNVLVFRPERNATQDWKSERFARTNNGTAFNAITDEPFFRGDSGIVTSQIFSTSRNHNGEIESYANTSESRIIRTNLRTDSMKNVFDLLYYKYMLNYGHLDPVTRKDYIKKLQSFYGSDYNWQISGQTVDSEKNEQQRRDWVHYHLDQYKTLDSRSVLRVTSAMLYWLATDENQTDIIKKKKANLWNEILTTHLGSTFSTNDDTNTWRYQDTIVFEINGRQYIIKKVENEALNPDPNPAEITLEITNPELAQLNQIKLSRAEFDKLVTIDPQQFYNWFVQQANITDAPQGSLKELLNSNQVKFGFYTFGIKFDNTKEQDKEDRRAYFPATDYRLINLFRVADSSSTDVNKRLIIDKELINDFSNRMTPVDGEEQKFGPLKFGIFLNVPARKPDPNSKEPLDSSWANVGVGNEGFVTDIIEVIAPIYGAEIIVGNIAESKDLDARFRSNTNAEVNESELISVNDYHQIRFNPHLNKFEQKIDNGYGVVQTQDWYYLGYDEHNKKLIIGNQNTIDGLSISITDDVASELRRVGVIDQNRQLFAYGIDGGQRFIVYREGNDLVRYDVSNTYATSSNDPKGRVYQRDLNTLSQSDQATVIFVNTNEERKDIVVEQNVTVEHSGNRKRFSKPILISRSYLDNFTTLPNDADWRSKYVDINDYVRITDFYESGGKYYISVASLNSGTHAQVIDRGELERLVSTLIINHGLIDGERNIIMEFQDKNIRTELENAKSLQEFVDILNKYTHITGRKFEIGLSGLLNPVVDDETIGRYLVHSFEPSQFNPNSNVSVTVINDSWGPDKVNVRVVTENGDEFMYSFKRKSGAYPRSQYYKNLWEMSKPSEIHTDTDEKIKEDFEKALNERTDLTNEQKDQYRYVLNHLDDMDPGEIAADQPGLHAITAEFEQNGRYHEFTLRIENLVADSLSLENCE